MKANLNILMSPKLVYTQTSLTAGGVLKMHNINPDYSRARAVAELEAQLAEREGIWLSRLQKADTFTDRVSKRLNEVSAQLAEVNKKYTTDTRELRYELAQSRANVLDARSRLAQVEAKRDALQGVVSKITTIMQSTPNDRAVVSKLHDVIKRAADVVEE